MPKIGHKATTPKQSSIILKDKLKKKYLNWVTKQAKVIYMNTCTHNK